MTIDTKHLRELHAACPSNNIMGELWRQFARAAHAALPELLDELERCGREVAAGSDLLCGYLDAWRTERDQLKAENRALFADWTNALNERDELRRVLTEATSACPHIAERDQWKAEADRYWQHIQDAKAENARLLADVCRLREERDWADVHMPVQVDLITGAELTQLGCCCASEDWTDATKGCTDAWLKTNGY